MASLATTDTKTALDYVLVDVNSSVLHYLDDVGPGSLYRTFGAGSGPAPELRVGVGDALQVTLFEAQSGGLFIPTDAGSRPGNYVTLPSQTVDSRGYITVPYAGRVLALHRTTPEIEREIVAKLQNRAIEPQALVTLAGQTSTQVTVVGDVAAPAKLSINPAGDRVLDAISRAGGIRSPGYEEFVTLERRGRKGTVYFLNLLNTPRENVFVAPGDVVYVQQNPRAFVAFGATGASGQFKFGQETLTLNDAVGRAGGLLDSRADPGQVLVYRIAPRATLERMGAPLRDFPAGQTAIPAIFRVNLRDPSGFFAARRFAMRDGDVVYVDNADQVEIEKFLTLLASATGAGASLPVNAAAAKASVAYLSGRCSGVSGLVSCP